MKNFFIRFIYFAFSSFIICALLYYSFMFISRSNPLKEIYWVYKNVYPLEYIGIISFIYSMGISVFFNKIKTIVNTAHRYSLVLILIFIAALFAFLCGIVLYNIHDKGWIVFEKEYFRRMSNSIFGYYFLYLHYGKEIVIRLLPIEMPAVILGIFVAEYGIFKFDNILKRYN